MSGDGRILKLSSLAALFVGLGTLIFGVVLAVGSMMDVDAWITAFDGLLASVYGVRTAILANVPSNTSSIRKKALILIVVIVATLGYLYTQKDNTLIAQFAMIAIILLIAVLAFVVASRIVKEQMRK